MKKIIIPAALLLIAGVFTSCNEEPLSSPSNTSISFEIETDNVTSLNNLLETGKLIVTIESPDQQPVIDLEPIAFYSQEKNFTTENLNLRPGNYIIKDFFITDANDQIIYAVPRKGSTLALRVRSPLNHSFNHSFSMQQCNNRSKSNLAQMTLIDVRRHQAKDMGYACFNAPKKVRIMVTSEKSGKPISASAFLVNGRDTVQRYALQPKLNQINIPAIADSATFIIYKRGFAPEYFTIGDLMTSRHRTLHVTLAAAFAMKTFGPSEFGIRIGGTGGTVNVDWGDGTTETHELGSNLSLEHVYHDASNFIIAITGSLININFFYSFYGQGMVYDIDFQHLGNLEEIRFGLSRCPRVIDLSANTKLKFALLTGLDDMEQLILPPRHNINWIWIAGYNRLSTQAVDAIIDNLYTNSIQQNIVNGWMGWGESWAQPETDEALVGPPSAAALEKVTVLKEDYGWEFYPDPLD